MSNADREIMYRYVQDTCPCVFRKSGQTLRGDEYGTYATYRIRCGLAGLIGKNTRSNLKRCFNCAFRSRYIDPETGGLKDTK